MERSNSILSDEELDQVVGGIMNFNAQTNKMTCSYDDGRVTQYKILNYQKAWEMSNKLHIQGMPEDAIISRMIDSGYIS